MKIAITATDQNIDANVDPRFGRCAFFIIYDTDTKDTKVIENASRNAMGGAGIQAAQSVSNEKVEAVITGNIGPNAFRVLSSAGIKVYTGISGSIKNAIESYNKNDMDSTSGPNVKSHFGTNQ